MSSQPGDVSAEFERIDGNLEAFRAKIQRLEEQIDHLEDVVEQREERIQELEGDAELALSIAARTEDAKRPDGGPTKKTKAMRLSRDEVIRRTAEGISAGPVNPHGEKANEIGSVTVSDVQNMALPETDLKWKTVAEDAWRELVEEWPCFEIDDDPKQLKVDPEAISRDLLQVVERSLDRDDLANRVVGEYLEGGA